MLTIICKNEVMRDAATRFATWLKIDEGMIRVKRGTITINDCPDTIIHGLCQCPVEGLVIITIAHDASDPLSTLAHEMVHAQQYLSGRMGPELSHWEGNEIENFSVADTETYLNLPWEKEAYSLQNKLATRYQRRWYLARAWAKIKSFF